MQVDERRRSIEHAREVFKSTRAGGVHRLSKLRGQTAAAREKPVNPACDTVSEA
jgi:hypothetical protein